MDAIRAIRAGGDSSMQLEGSTVLILGGSGLVGLAVAREVCTRDPAAVVICGLTRRESEEAVAELAAELPHVRFRAEWGDVFLAESLRERRRADVLADADARAMLVDDLFGELTEDVIRRSAMGSMLLRHRPQVIVDCINTATAFAYQNIFNSVAELRTSARAGQVDLEQVERHLATLYLPQLIRHVQIAMEAMKRCGTQSYVKVGTAGTGGMGLNIPFTHSEERPSRMLLAKAGLAGAHTLLLYLMARTPGAPAVKEIKPTAAISWKRIGYGPVTKRGAPIDRVDADPIPLEAAFTAEGAAAYRSAGEPLDGVYLDAGENGLFSLGEFETLTALGLMEFITPEEIASNVVREILGKPTGRDVVAALDASTSGPTYRAGVLRETALQRMEALEAEHGVRAVAYEMLGPPRLSKLLFEAAILSELFPDLRAVAALDPDDAAARADALVAGDAELRTRMLSIGIPVLLADGQRMLRGPDVHVEPDAAQPLGDPRLADNGWVDLRPANWRKWSQRAGHMIDQVDRAPGADDGSRFDTEPGGRGLTVRPGRMVAWVFRYEDRGERRKR
jgi:NAD(P)-dependent dehydrogenase (short-subunit alcohol dehydrogenase family)